MYRSLILTPDVIQRNTWLFLISCSIKVQIMHWPRFEATSFYKRVVAQWIVLYKRGCVQLFSHCLDVKMEWYYNYLVPIGIYTRSDRNERSEYRIKAFYLLSLRKVTFSSPFIFQRAFGKWDFILVYVCCTEHQQSFLCPTIFSTPCIYLPPTPTQPYTHACPTATGPCAYMHIWNQVIWRNQINAGKSKCWNALQ